MSVRFLQQLARRALATPDIRPRVASRFESSVRPLELSVEHVAPAPISPAEPHSFSEPPPVAPDARAERTAPSSHDVQMPTPTPVVARSEVIERIAHVVALAPATRPAPHTQKVMEVTTHPPLTAKPDESLPVVVPALPGVAPPPVAAPLDAPAARALPPASIFETTASQRLTPPATAARAPHLLAPQPPLPTTSAAVAPRVPTSQPPAPIQIVIGRIEIRGEDAPAPAPRPVPATPRASSISLDEYLRTREGRTQ